jgi:hypothetical protein
MRSKPKPKPERRVRGPSKFRKTEIARAARGMLAAGLPVRGIEIDPATGRFVVLIGQPTEGGDLDNWLAKREKNARQA